MFTINDNYNGTVDIYYNSTFRGTMNAIAFIQEYEFLTQFGTIEWM